MLAQQQKLQMSTYSDLYDLIDNIYNIDSYPISCIYNQQGHGARSQGLVLRISRWFNSYPQWEYKIDRCRIVGLSEISGVFVPLLSD